MQTIAKSLIIAALAFGLGFVTNRIATPTAAEPLEGIVEWEEQGEELRLTLTSPDHLLLTAGGRTSPAGEALILSQEQAFFVAARHGFQDGAVQTNIPCIPPRQGIYCTPVNPDPVSLTLCSGVVVDSSGERTVSCTTFTIDVQDPPPIPQPAAADGPSSEVR